MNTLPVPNTAAMNVHPSREFSLAEAKQLSCAANSMCKIQLIHGFTELTGNETAEPNSPVFNTLQNR